MILFQLIFSLGRHDLAVTIVLCLLGFKPGISTSAVLYMALSALQSLLIVLLSIHVRVGSGIIPRWQSFVYSCVCVFSCTFLHGFFHATIMFWSEVLLLSQCNISLSHTSGLVVNFELADITQM